MVPWLSEILPLLIPVLALLIGLVVVGSIFLVQPLVQAITRLADAHDGGLSRSSVPESQRIEQRLAWLEGTLQQVLDEAEFERKLQASASPSTLYAEPAREMRVRDEGGEAGEERLRR